jgi:hypothetical protein
MENLYSMEEWLEYISKIKEVELIDHARYLGSQKFQNEMEAQGYEVDDVWACLQALVLRFLQTNTRVPAQMEGSLVDFQQMADEILA